ncbi:MAG: type II secretion system protein N [Halioglobus sp.]
MYMRSWAAGLAALTLVLIIVNAPARLLGYILPEQGVILSGYSGGLWRGGASRCLITVPGGYLHLGAIEWSLRPLSLLLLSPSLSITSSWGQQQISGQVTVHGSQDVSLADFDAKISAGILQQFLPVALAGDLSARVEHLTIRGGESQHAEGRLVWQRGAWKSPQGMHALGSYAIDFAQQEQTPLVGELITLEGPIKAEGSVQLQGRAYNVDVAVGTEDSMDTQLQRALSLLARPVDDGYHLVLQGEI